MAEGMRVGRNDPCPCGSGKKYKSCCMRSGGGKRGFTAKVITSKPARPEEEPFIPPLEQKVDLMERAFGRVVSEIKGPLESVNDLRGKVKKKGE